MSVGPAPPTGRSLTEREGWKAGTAKRRASVLPGLTPAEGGAPVRNAELQSYVVNKIELLKRNQFHIKKITQLCSFIPDFIIMDEINRKIPYQFSCEAVVLMADISGFTALTEAYSLRGKGGTDQLTKTLAGYIGPLAECILLAEGDIVKYAGDAFIAYWKSGGDSYPQDIQRVIDCALYIQEKYGFYLCKEVDITIRVKIGIGAGMVHFSWIGTEVYQHWVAFGPGVKGASAAEKRCESGDVVMDPGAWAHCVPLHYRFSIKKEPFVHLHEIVILLNEFKRGRPMPSRKSRKESGTPITDLDKIRNQVQIAVDRKPEAIMRPFVIPPVLRKLDDDIPVEYLNESRVVCICFIHVKYDDKVDNDEKNFRDNMATIVQRAFIKIYQNVTILQGALSKVIMFDKGLTYLVVFGLPGYINENQSAHALQFSYRTRLALKAIKYVTEVSIGVTTGSCYCGVIGHPRRQEYTVIGRKVNKAARLMVYYPGRLTCDQDTAYFSKLPIDNFKLMEAKELKGIKDAGKIYEFVSADDSDDTSIPFFQYPLLGRETELAYFKNALVRTKRELEQSNIAQNMGGGAVLSRVAGKDTANHQKAIWMIIFEGDNGIGKSRMLSACVQEAEKMNIRIFTVGMNLASSTQTQFAISCLVVDALGMLELRTVQEREEYLRKHVSDPDLAADLCLINEILHTKFPLNPKYTALDVNAGHLLAQHVMYSLLRTTYPNDLILFVVDDAHLMDFRSWEYIVYISKFQNIFTLCSLRRSNAGSPKLPETVSKQIYHNKNIKIIRMTGVESNCLLPLACQIMQVRAIPADLEKLIINKSAGVPAWIVQVLNELLRTGIIRLQDETFRYKQTMVFAEKMHLEKMDKRIRKHFRRWALDGNDENVKYKPSDLTEQATNVKEEEINPMDRILVIKSDTNIASVPVSGTLKEIVLDAFDELSPNEQILLKAATVLGTRFSRKMLTRLLPSYETWSKKFDQCFNKLMETKYFRCASGTVKQKEKASAINAKPECFCREDEYSYQKDNEGKPLDRRLKYYTCRFMEFMKENMVEVVYDIMTEDQRSELHLKAGNYLDSCVVRCESCGGEDRSYLFGFIKPKANEYALDTDEALRMAGQSRRHSNKTMERENVRRASNSSYQQGDRRRRTLVTQLEGLKRTFETSGNKMGHMELDILKNLIEFDHHHHHHTWKHVCCCQTKKAVEKQFLEEEAEIKEFEHKEVQLHPHLDDQLNLEVPSTNGTPSVAPNTAIGGSLDLLGGSGPAIPERGQNAAFGMVDLRMCQCAVLQAKVCVEKVWHYREAKKYGRCLLNLLRASEFDITVGNGTLALVHIQDAIGLLRQIKDGDIPTPDKEDQDDNVIDDKDAEAQIEFLSGLAYFEIGVNAKAREYFLKALRRLGLVIHFDDNGLRRDAAILRAKFKLCRVRNFGCCYNVGHKKYTGTDDFQDESWPKKIRILTYLHNLFKTEKKIEMAMLVTIWQVILAEEYGEIMNDVIPAYANMIDIYGELSRHTQAKEYERMSLALIRATLGSTEQVVPIRMVTSANLFLTLAGTRLNRGEINSSSKAAYLALRVTQSIHDNALTVRILPLLCQSLLHSLRISEVAEALQKLWFLSEEADDWIGVSSYYAMCLDLLLNTTYPLEQFGVCENFILNSDWTAETSMFRDFETQYSMESSLALWYARYSRWESAQRWFTEADNHRPKHPSYTVVNSELKLLECQLIIVNHYLDSKRYQHFSKARNAAKELMRSLTKSTSVVPVLKPRFVHLLAYYYRIRSRNVEADKQLKIAEKLALQMGNYLEQEWITHSRSVWADMAIPTIKYFWVEHTEVHTLDWHSSGKIPWANIMYSLPLPAWK